ncbi:MAG: hypothetical protein E7I10_20190 [Enterobacter asburiae]|nr:hypothetical protein [Enterobacter asburiae]
MSTGLISLAAGVLIGLMYAVLKVRGCWRVNRRRAICYPATSRPLLR